MRSDDFFNMGYGEILVIDDSAAYLKLLVDMLTEAGYHVRQAMSGELAIRCIKTQSPSLILLDVMMPGIDGFEVCRQLKANEETRDIPVIFISAADNREFKITGFQVGGVDFISKPFQKEEVLARIKTHLNLYQLQHELQDKNTILETEIADRKLAQAALLESEERYRTTLYSIGDGVITTDTGGRIRMMNQVAEQLTGWSQSEASGKSLEEIFRIINEETRTQVEIPVRKVLREGLVVGLANHTLLITKDGAELPIADSGAPIRNEKGEIIGVVLVFRDQTEEREAEKGLRHSQLLLKSSLESPEGMIIFSIDKNYKYLYFNKTHKNIMKYAYNSEIEIGVNILECISSTEDRNNAKINYDLAMSGKSHTTVQEYGDIERSYFESNYNPIFNNKNEIIGITVFAKDITERKLADEAIRESERTMQTLFDTMTEGVTLNEMIFDKNGEIIDYRIVKVNKGFYKVANYHENDVVGQLATQIYGMTSEYIKLFWDEHISKTEAVISEMYIPQQKRYYSISTSPIVDNCFVTTFFDITERHLAENALKESESRLQLSLKINRASVFENNFETGVVFTTPELYQFLGYEPEENPKTMAELSKLIHPDDYAMVLEALAEHVSGKTAEYYAEFRMLSKAGKWSWVDGIGKVIQKNEKGEPVVLIGISRDINDRKQVEQKLQRSEQELKKAQQITHIGSWYLNLANNEVFWTEELYKMYGFDPSLPVPLYTEHKKLFTPESWELLSTSLAKTTETGIPYELELKTVREDGSNGWMWVRSETVKDDVGKTVGLWGAAQDISDRKNAEQALFESEEMMRTSQSVAHICSYSTTLNLNEPGKSTWRCSPEFYNVFGIDKTYPHTIEGWAGFIHPDHLEEMVTYHEYVIKERIPFDHEYKIIRINDGAERWIYGTGKLELDEKGKPVRMYGAIQDITDRKKVERAVNESKKMLELVMASIPQFIFWKDRNSVYLGCNQNFASAAGLKSTKEIEGKTDYDLPWKKEEADFFVESDRKVMDNGIGEYHIIEPQFQSDGKQAWLDTNKVPIFDENGLVIGILGTYEDITERKQVEENLKINQMLLRSIIDGTNDAVFIKDENGKYIVFNKAASDMVGMCEAEVIGKTDMVIFPFEDGKAVMEADRNIMESGQVNIIEELVTLADGNKHHFLATKGPLFDIDGKLTGMFGISRDITDRKEAEEALRQSEERYSLAVDASEHGIWDWNIETNEVYFSEQWKNQIGYTDQEIKNDFSVWVEHLHPDDKEACLNAVQSYLDNPVKHFILEFRFRHKDGNYRWIHNKASSIKGSNGKVVRMIGAHTDITEQKLAEQTLEESEKKFRTLVESSPDGISLLDLDGTIMFANNRKAEMIGVKSSTDLIGLNVYSLIAPAYLETFVSCTDEFMKNGQLKDLEAEVVRHDGSTFRAEFNLLLVTDENGVPAFVMDTMRDITERRKAEETIQNDHQLLRALIDNLPFAIYVKDREARKLVANTADIRIMNCASEEDALGKTDFEIFKEETDKNGFLEDMAVIQTDQAMLNKENCYLDTDGTLHWRVISKIPLHDKTGNVTGLIGFGRDITPQKKAYETINKLSKSIEQSPSTIVITDIQGNIEYVNPKFFEITGYTQDEVIGKNPRILKGGEMPAEKYKELWDIISTGGVWRGEFHNRKKNGELYWEWATMTSIKDDQGKIVNYIAIKEDISLRKQMEVDLIAAKEKAEENDRLKSAFLANMSHEVRTPLNSIIGFSDLLLDPDFEYDQKEEFIHHIIKNGNNLLTIISDIMDISKMESGQITIRKNHVQANKLMYELKQQYSTIFQEKKLEFRLNFPESERELFVKADVERLYQIFNNLINNALKFTSMGHVQIELQEVNEMVQFSVRDTGIGIPPEYHDKIFDRFRQVENATTRKYGGNGLGLAITRNLIELMGGKIWLKSELGKGSTFYFTLPKS